MRGHTSLAAILLGLYAAQSITGSMVQTALPVVLRDAGVPLDRIGFLSLLFLPWVFKMLWAPLVDRIATPHIWILACQGLLCLCFALGARVSPVANLTALSLILFIMTVIAATQDIATDAAGIHATGPQNRVLASGASTIGGYFGFLLGGGVWLWTYARLGWGPAMMALALIMLMLTLLSTRLRLPPIPEHSGKASLRHSLRNPALLSGAGFLILWQSGIRLGGAMAGPMLVDAGLDLGAIAWLRGAGGMAIGLAAAVIGTFAVRRLGKTTVLVFAGALALASLAGLAWWGLHPGSVPVLAALQIALMGATAMSFVALYAAMMDWCAPDQAATDFALLQSLDAALAVATGVLAGLMAENWGYAPVFALAGALLLAALPFTRMRLDHAVIAAPPSTPLKTDPLT